MSLDSAGNNQTPTWVHVKYEVGMDWVEHGDRSKANEKKEKHV